MSHSRRAFCAGGFLLSFLALQCGAFADVTRKVRVAVPSWDAGAIIAHDIGRQLTERFGSEVTYVDLEGEVVWAELEQGDGKIDVFPDIWLPNQQQFFDDYVGRRRTVGANSSPYHGEQGFFALVQPLPRDFSTKDLTDPNFIRLFDSDGDGKGEYWPGAEGWHSKLYSKLKMRDYKAAAQWQEITATNEEFLKILADRANKRIGTLFYYWEPDAIHAKYQLRLMAENSYREGCKTFIEPSKDKDWFDKSAFPCAYPRSFIHVLYRLKLSPNGDLERFLQSYQVDPQKLKDALLRVREHGASFEEAATALH